MAKKKKKVAKKTVVKKTAVKVKAVKIGVKVTHNVGEKTKREDIMEDVKPTIKAEESTPALVEDDIVTIRGGKGGVTRMLRSEYNKKYGKNKD